MPRLACLALLAVVGCGDGNAVGRVTGVVRLDGKPLGHTDVTFWPKDDSALGTYATRSGTDGRFELFRDPRPGSYIKPGRYVALVAKVTPAPAEVEVAAVASNLRNSLPPIYDDKQRSPLIVDIKAGDNDVPLDLKSRP
jgi:hypothetical protein